MSGDPSTSATPPKEAETLQSARGVLRERSVWPYGDSIGPLPVDSAAALAPDGPWGLAARGAEVRECPGDKGMGAFAVRKLSAGDLVGLYWGEQLTLRECLLRSSGESVIAQERGGSRGGGIQALLDRASINERRTRLAALTHGAPMGGDDNRGGYTFVLPSNAYAVVRGERVHGIDAEDPNRSSWCRYLNHAPEDTDACNVVKHIDAQGHIWFAAKVDILPGTELCFAYSDACDYS